MRTNINLVLSLITETGVIISFGTYFKCFLNLELFLFRHVLNGKKLLNFETLGEDKKNSIPFWLIK
jgi:hypothetical protein